MTVTQFVDKTYSNSDFREVVMNRVHIVIVEPTINAADDAKLRVILNSPSTEDAVVVETDPDVIVYVTDGEL